MPLNAVRSHTSVRYLSKSGGKQPVKNHPGLDFCGIDSSAAIFSLAMSANFLPAQGAYIEIMHQSVSFSDLDGNDGNLEGFY